MSGGSEDTAALHTVLMKATSLLDSLNDAIERAVRHENQLYYQAPTRASPSSPLEHTSHQTASSDSPGDYHYMLAGDNHPMPQMMAQGGNGPREGFEVVQGEAKLLSEIRETLSAIEETLYKVLELKENDEEERASALQEIERCRELLLTMLKGHKGLEKEVVQEVLIFCSGRVPEEPTDEQEEETEAWENQEELEADEEEDEVEDEEQRRINSPNTFYSPQVYRRNLVSPYSNSYATPQPQGYYRRPRSLPRPGFETDETGEGRGGSGEAPRRRRISSTPPGEDKEGRAQKTGSEEGEAGENDGGKGEEGRKGVLSAILTFPGFVLCTLGDAVGHAANFGVKLAVVGLGAAAVVSLGQEIAVLYRNNRKRQLRERVRKSGRTSGGGEAFECTIRERVEMKKVEDGGVQKDAEVFLAVG